MNTRITSFGDSLCTPFRPPDRVKLRSLGLTLWNKIGRAGVWGREGERTGGAVGAGSWENLSVGMGTGEGARVGGRCGSGRFFNLQFVRAVPAWPNSWRRWRHACLSRPAADWPMSWSPAVPACPHSRNVLCGWRTSPIAPGVIPYMRRYAVTKSRIPPAPSPPLAPCPDFGCARTVLVHQPSNLLSHRCHRSMAIRLTRLRLTPAANTVHTAPPDLGKAPHPSDWCGSGFKTSATQRMLNGHHEIAAFIVYSSRARIGHPASEHHTDRIFPSFS